ncbi:hypothetical protein OHC33_004789 [Knufia fluminis]|uniref:Uncharacterized protein n=1 Tax=Knufia fluminis TaxID=191047 RepID=A0AAN8I882_9EURO|nr:hypothetical protein OHC33_004789 [Knufia fluminis]
MEAPAQTTTRTSFTPVNIPQNVLTHSSVNSTAETATNDMIDNSRYASPKLSDDGGSDVLEDVPSKSPMDMAGEMTDTDDMITVYTARPATKTAEASANIHDSAGRDTRPDYSSRTSESEDDQSPAENKFFLESDIPSRHVSKRDALPASKEPSVEGLYKDPNVYTKCMRCISGHLGCDRRAPFCNNCKSASDCVYLKKAGFRNQGEALQAYRASLPPEKKDLTRRESSFKAPHTMIKSETPRPQAKTTMKSIEWLDGDISHSQKKCPSSIMKLIGKHLAEFEASVAATIWPKSKTCYIDKGRDIQYVDAETDQEIPVARYTYGGGQQFFVVWLPPKDPNEVPRPAISKVRVYNNDGPKIRNGKSWKPWVPHGVHHRARDIVRYMRDLAPNEKWIPSDVKHPASLDVVDLDLGESNEVRPPSRQRSASTLLQAGSKRARNDSVVSNDDTQNGMHTSKRRKSHNVGQSWKDNPNMVRERGPGGLFSGRPSVASIDEPTHSHATRSSTKATLPKPTARPPSTRFIVREPTRKGPNLAVVFQDSSGEVRGTYPYDECDTAQKLFDVACVAQIAQIEPPATRLLKIQFDGGGEGRIRPDNEQDFENVFEAELKKLIDGDKGRKEFRVTVTP